MIDEEAYAYYYALRTHARSRVVNSLNRHIKSQDDRDVWRGITLASINQDALEQARVEWPKHYRSDIVGVPLPYSWERLFHKFAHVAAHFNVAIWQDLGETKILQGMAVGKPSKGQTHLIVNWVERSFAPTYLRGGTLLPILACAEEYARLLECERVLVKDAIVPEQFERYGYSAYKHAGPGRFLAKEL